MSKGNKIRMSSKSPSRCSGGVHLLWVKLVDICMKTEAQEMPSVISYIQYVSKFLISFVTIMNAHIVSIFCIKQKES